MFKRSKKLKVMIVVLSISLYVLSLFTPSMGVSTVHRGYENNLSVSLLWDPSFEYYSHIGLVPLISGRFQLFILLTYFFSFFLENSFQYNAFIDFYYCIIWFVNPLYLFTLFGFFSNKYRKRCVITSIASTFLILSYVLYRPEITSGILCDFLFGISRSYEVTYCGGAPFNKYVFITTLDVGFWFWLASSMILLFGSLYYYEDRNDVHIVEKEIS